MSRGQNRRALGAALLAAGTVLLQHQSRAFVESPSTPEGGQSFVAKSPALVAIAVALVCAVLTRQEPPVPPDAAVPVEKRDDFSKLCVISWVLCFVSGMVNIVAFYETTFLVAHQSGNTCHMGRLGLAGGHFAVIVLCYLIGAGVPGYCKSNGDAPIHGYYCPAMLAAGVATLAGVWIFAASKGEAKHEMLALWAFGQGMQNSVTTRFSSMPLRTTHHTGSITDAGSAIGLWLRATLLGETLPPMSKPIVLVVCILGYAAGAFAAHHATDAWGIYAALPPATVMALIGLGRGSQPAHKSA